MVLLIVAFVMGCGGGGSNGVASAAKSAGGKVAFTVKWPARSKSTSRVIPLAADYILFTYTSTGANPVTIGSDADKLTRPFGDAGGSSTYTRDLPVGSYVVSARAFSSQDATVPVATGVAPLTIKGGMTAQATLTMGSTVASVQVSPSATSVAVGGTATLTATPEDDQGNQVLVDSSTVAWTSSDPTVATVDATGLTPTVHGIKAGSVTLIATFDEVEPSLKQTPVASAGASVTVGGSKYRLIDLGTLGGAASYGYAVNASGQVTGISVTSGDAAVHAFLSAPNGGALKDLGTLGGPDSSGMAVNASGQVAGASGSHAFLSAPDGGALKALGTLGGSYSVASAVNASGQVAGVSVTAGNAATHAFLSAPNGGALTDLGTLPGGDESQAYGVNASGQVAGWSHSATGDHAFLSAPNGGALNGLGTETSYGYAVNASGQVTGSWQTGNIFLSAPDGGALTNIGFFGYGDAVNASGQVAANSAAGITSYHAFLSAPGGGALTDLGTLGGTYSYAKSVNASGQVVGYSAISGDQAYHGFLYTAGAGMQDLSGLLDASGAGWTVNTANGINDKGWIAAWATNSVGQTHAVLLVPTS